MLADNRLSLSRTSLKALLDHSGFEQRIIYDLRYNHFSYEIQFDESHVRPIAIRKCTTLIGREAGKGVVS
jgi:hypothetical protein